MSDGFLPDLIINKALPNVAIPFIKAYKQNAANTTAIFQDGSFRRNTLLAALGSAADNQVGVSNIAFSNNASGKLFAQEQQAVTGWAPAAYESQGYDAMVLSLLAMVKVSVTNAAAGNMDPTTMTGTQVRDALNQLNDQDPANAATRVTFGSGATELARGIAAIEAGLPVDYVGASGNVNFDAVGDTRDIATLWKIEGGQFKEKQIFDCEASDACTLIPTP